MGGGFLGIGGDAMGYLQSIDICLMLEVAAERISHRFCKESQDSEQDEYHRHGRPVAQFADAGVPLEDFQGPAGEPVNQIKTKQQAGGSGDHAVDDVMKDVMTHFVPEDK